MSRTELPVPSPWLVPFDGTFEVSASPTAPPDDAPDEKKLKKKLRKKVERLADLQRILYAENERALLLVFQAMDAGGKDSTIRAVTSGVNPAGFQVSSFKRPSENELDHDFLWRSARRLPERGRIGIFNRSYYEEVLVVRVHPEILESQRLPERPATYEELWAERYESIREHERHLARNGTTILKFWLNVSPDEQRRRFLSRLDEPRKHWKFAAADVRERSHWSRYMAAYEDALRATSRPWAPWYAIPADSKPFMRREVARIIVRTLEALDLRYPEPEEAEKARFDEMRSLLEGEE